MTECILGSQKLFKTKLSQSHLSKKKKYFDHFSDSKMFTHLYQNSHKTDKNQPTDNLQSLLGQLQVPKNSSEKSVRIYSADSVIRWMMLILWTVCSVSTSGRKAWSRWTVVTGRRNVVMCCYHGAERARMAWHECYPRSACK